MSEPAEQLRWSDWPDIGFLSILSHLASRGLASVCKYPSYRILSKLTGYLKNTWIEPGVSQGAKMFSLDNPTIYWRNIKKIQDEAGSAVYNAYPLKLLYKSCDHCHVGLSVRGSKMYSYFITRANASSVFMCRQSPWPLCTWEIKYEKVQLNCTSTRQSQRRTLCQVSIDPTVATKMFC